MSAAKRDRPTVGGAAQETGEDRFGTQSPMGERAAAGARAAVADAAAMRQMRADHGLVQARLESVDFARARYSFGSSYRQGHRAGFWRGVEWLRGEQLRVDDLSVAEYVAELRKGAGSVFWPLWRDDPKFGATCERCGHLIVLDAEGLCPDCGWEVE